MKKKFSFTNALIVIVSILSVLLFISIVINLVIKATTKDYIITEEEATALTDVDCILVLGCGVYDDGTPSPMLCDRVTVGARLYKAGVSERLLMSGDHGRVDYNEVATMKELAMYPNGKEEGASAEIPGEVIFCDHAGFSTYESMIRARDIFQAEKIVIVTQGFHIERAVYIARTLGLDAYGVTADERSYQSERYNEFREFAANCKDFFYCLFQAEPTYRGDPVPIDGTYPDSGWE